MGWDEIPELGAAGVREIVRSRALLERALGTSCTSIAAPFGEANDRFVRIARRCGYEIGLIAEPGFARLDSDPLRLPRIEVPGHWSLEQFTNAMRPSPSPAQDVIPIAAGIYVDQHRSLAPLGMTLRGG
jgi:peptidoglycan/xylan/chitin deacetylase (PgdA/CDA1 family)